MNFASYFDEYTLQNPIELSEFDNLFLVCLRRDHAVVSFNQKLMKYPYGRLARKNTIEFREIFEEIIRYHDILSVSVSNAVAQEAIELYNKHRDQFTSDYKSLLRLIYEVNKVDFSLAKKIIHISKGKDVPTPEQKYIAPTRDNAQYPSSITLSQYPSPYRTSSISRVIFPDGTIGSSEDFIAFQKD